jgi:hypothetical protein
VLVFGVTLPADLDRLGRFDNRPPPDFLFLVQELFNFELKFYRAAPVAFFERLILLNVPVDEQVLDLGYSGSFSLSHCQPPSKLV